MNTPFYFVTLHYRPSYFLGEVVNIGVLLWFEETQKLFFVYPNQLERLKRIYFDINLNSIKNSLKAFEQQAVELNDSRELFLRGFNKNILAEYFLVPDANSFFFGEWKAGLTNGREIDKIIEYYKMSYLKYYFHKISIPPHDETYLKKQFRQAIAHQTAEKHLFKEYIFFAGSQNLSHEFPYAWKNGTLNLVTPISFDLKKQHSIQSKAARWLGLFSIIEAKNKDANICFDILLAEPTNKELLPIYEDAKAIITDIPSLQYRFWEEDQIEEYAKYISESAVVI